MPWVYIRHMLATRWGMPPWEVDEAPLEEINLELEIMQLEGEAAHEAEQRRS